MEMEQEPGAVSAGILGVDGGLDSAQVQGVDHVQYAVGQVAFVEPVMGGWREQKGLMRVPLSVLLRCTHEPIRSCSLPLVDPPIQEKQMDHFDQRMAAPSSSTCTSAQSISSP